jgi:hypothetical protein
LAKELAKELANGEEAFFAGRKLDAVDFFPKAMNQISPGFLY